MSLQLMLVAGFLYAEVALALLLSSPIASPSKWHKLFKSKFLKVIVRQLSKYFNIIIFVLVLFLCDSIRELRKYSELSAEERDKYANLDVELLVGMRLFRAQRNFYMCGFALLLGVVLRRLVVLISEQAELLKTLKSRGDGDTGNNDTTPQQPLKREKKEAEAIMGQSELRHSADNKADKKLD